MTFSSNSLVQILITISFMLFIGRLLSELFIKLKQPGVLGEILAGIIIGPTIMGRFIPSFYKMTFPQIPELNYLLDGIINLAVIMLILVLGLEVDLSTPLKKGKKIVIYSIFPVIIPFIIAFIFAYLTPIIHNQSCINNKLLFSFFFGTAIFISALPVIARILLDLNLFKTEIGSTIISSAIIIDLIGWLSFSLVLSSSGLSKLSLTTLIFNTLYFLLFIILIILLGRKVINRILRFANSHLSYPGSILTILFTFGYLSAAFTEHIGYHSIIGAFAVGIAFGDSVFLKEDIKEGATNFVMQIFAPIFFVSIGLKVDFFNNFNFTLVTIVILLAIISKFLACYVSARLTKTDTIDYLIIAFSLNSRGAVEIILSLVALKAGIINEQLFVALVIMALFTSLIAPPSIKYLLKNRKLSGIKDLLMQTDIIFSQSASINEFGNEINNHFKNKYELYYKEIQFLLSNFSKNDFILLNENVSFVHTRTTLSKPHLSIFVAKKSIADTNFSTKIVIILISPQDDYKLHLDLLAGIANIFVKDISIETLISTNNKNLILNKLQTISLKYD